MADVVLHQLPLIFPTLELESSLYSCLFAFVSHKLAHSQLCFTGCHGHCSANTQDYCQDAHVLLLRSCRARQMGTDLVYVSGRKRKPGEMNGKSCNLNNCLSQIYPEGVPIPTNELVCIFDADQVKLQSN